MVKPLNIFNLKQGAKLLTLLFVLLLNKSWGQTTILTWDFESNNNAVINLPGGATTISSNGISIATAACNGTNGYGGSAWNVGDYIQILTPTTGYAIGTLTFNVRCSNTGPANFKVQYSSTGVGGTFIDFATFVCSNAGSCNVKSIDFSSVSLLNCNSNAVVRLVFTGGEADGSPSTGDAASGGTFRMDDVALTGSASCSGTTYTATFNSNGGTGTMSNQTASSSTSLTTNAFTRTCYAFTGWNTIANGSGTAYANNALYSFTADITLYAQWASTTRTVTFNSNGGSGTMSNQTACASTALSSNTFTNSNSVGTCTFTGWNTAANGSGTSYTNGQSYSFGSNLTLYAQWNCPSAGTSTCINEGFESGLPTSYSSSSWNLTSGTWTGVNVIRGTTSNSGLYACQLQNATGSQIYSPSVTNPLTLSFWASASTASGAMQVAYSSDGGSTWTQVTGSPFALTTSYQQFNINLNLTGSYLIRFYRTGATVYIDDINVVCNSGGGSSGSSNGCPTLISAVINSCDGCADEGNNEFLVLSTGGYSFAVNPTNVKIIYSNGPTNITSSFAAQPTSLASLNTTSINACGTTFVDVSNGATTVPANSKLFIMNKGACFTGNWSGYCGLGTVYVAFSSATAWITAGFFGNNNTARTFTTDFSAVSGTCGVTVYGYNQSGVSGTPYSFGSDGASVIFNGNSAPTYVDGNGECAPPNTILPIELIDFYGTQESSKNNLVWKVASENNILEYILEKSEDGLLFHEISRVKSKNSNQTTLYSSEDLTPHDGITYYRLSTVETNGEISKYKIIHIDKNDKEWEIVHYQQNNYLNIEFKNSLQKNTTISLFDLTGKLMIEETATSSFTKINTQSFSEGIYFLKLSSPYKTQNIKIIIQK